MSVQRKHDDAYHLTQQAWNTGVRTLHGLCKTTGLSLYYVRSALKRMNIGRCPSPRVLRPHEFETLLSFMRPLNEPTTLDIRNEVRRLFNRDISESTARRYKKTIYERRQQELWSEPRGRKPLLTDEQFTKILQVLRASNTTPTFNWLTHYMSAAYGVKNVSRATVYRYIAILKQHL